MRLTSEQVQDLVRRLGQYDEIQCPLCHHTEWNVNDLIVESREFLRGDLALNGAIMPLVPVSCRHCGNTMFLNAIQLGYVSREQNGQREPETSTSR